MYRKILVTSDGSAICEEAFPHAAQLAAENAESCCCGHRLAGAGTAQISVGAVEQVGVAAAADSVEAQRSERDGPHRVGLAGRRDREGRRGRGLRSDRDGDPRAQRLEARAARLGGRPRAATLARRPGAARAPRALGLARREVCAQRAASAPPPRPTEAFTAANGWPNHRDRMFCAPIRRSRCHWGASCRIPLRRPAGARACRSVLVSGPSRGITTANAAATGLIAGSGLR